MKFTKDEITKYLALLAAELREAGYNAKITVYGGAALVDLGLRDYTRDIDYTSKSQAAVAAAAAKVAVTNRLEAGWLNDAVSRRKCWLGRCRSFAGETLSCGRRKTWR